MNPDALSGAASTGEQIAFFVLGPLALLGAIGMVFAKNAVHSALWLASTMLSIGVMYLMQGAQFLGFVQIIVYTGAIMMLFLFVLMLTGRESGDSIIEVLRGQRVAALMVGGALAAPLAALVVRYLPARVLGVCAGGLIVLTNLTTLAEHAGASGVTVGLLASVVFTVWVLWVAWAVKLEQEADAAARVRTGSPNRTHATA